LVDLADLEASFKVAEGGVIGVHSTAWAEANRLRDADRPLVSACLHALMRLEDMDDRLRIVESDLGRMAVISTARGKFGKLWKATAAYHRTWQPDDLDPEFYSLLVFTARALAPVYDGLLVTRDAPDGARPSGPRAGARAGAGRE
jgi:hypothetical protein